MYDLAIYEEGYQSWNILWEKKSVFVTVFALWKNVLPSLEVLIKAEAHPKLKKKKTLKTSSEFQVFLAELVWMESNSKRELCSTLCVILVDADFVWLRRLNSHVSLIIQLHWTHIWKGTLKRGVKITTKKTCFSVVSYRQVTIVFKMVQKKWWTWRLRLDKLDWFRSDSLEWDSIFAMQQYNSVWDTIWAFKYLFKWISNQM